MFVDRVAREAAAQMIVNAAGANAAQREQHEVLKVGLLKSVTRTPKQFEQRGVGKFGSALDTTVHAIHHGGEAGRIIVDEGDRQVAGSVSAVGIAQRVAKRLAIGADALGLRAVDIRDLTQNIAKRGPTVASLLGKIGAAPERLARARQEHREGPAATLTHGMQRCHIDLVDVGTFLPIDLYVDEKLVHERGGFAVFETLVRHHMAPVAGRVANRQQDRLISLLGFRQRRLAPHPPMGGIL